MIYRTETDLHTLLDGLTNGELIKALNFVLDEHHPFTSKLWAPECLDRECEHGRIEDCPSTLVQLCAACSDLAEMVHPYFAKRNLTLVSYPCPTVKAIATALEVEA